MPTYPDICESEGSERVLRDGRLVRVATNGKPRVRTLFSTVYEDPTIVYNDLSADQVAAIKEFYNDNKGNSFTLHIHGENVDVICVFNTPAYKFTPYNAGKGNIRFKGQVNFIQES